MDAQVKRKRVQLSVDERLKRKQQALENAKKDLQDFKRKISAKARKDRAHRLIELGAFVESFLHTSTNEEAITLITTHMKNVAQAREQRQKENASSQS